MPIKAMNQCFDGDKWGANEATNVKPAVNNEKGITNFSKKLYARAINPSFYCRWP